MIIPAQDDNAVGSDERAKKPIDVLVRLASTARLFRTSDGRVHAQVKVGDRQEFYALKSAAFRDWLTDAYFAESGEPPSEWAIRRIIGVLRAKARFDGGTPTPYIRVGRERGGEHSAYCVDLGDSSGRAIWISAEGWLVVDRPDVHFQRPAGLLPLPVPDAEGKISLLKPYVNVSDDDFQLLVAWLTAALRPVGPYPALVLYGEQGSAKTTLARILRLLIDPQACPVLSEPRSTRDLMVTAVNGWLLIYDNISTLPDWLSDSLCRLVSGGGYSARSLFSNDERTMIYAQRPMILNGIEDFVRRGDLIDRSVILNLPPIPGSKRRPEDEFWKAFNADYPRILGGVLNVLVGGLRELSQVQLPELPRMADYARWGGAIGRALGWHVSAFTATYERNRALANAPALEDSLVATTLLELGPRLQAFWGGPVELLRELTIHLGQKEAEVRRMWGSAAARESSANWARWPKEPRQFSKELRRVLPLLRAYGITAEFYRRSRGSGISFTYTPPDGANDASTGEDT
jgi:hypothetical protein